MSELLEDLRTNLVQRRWLLGVVLIGLGFSGLLNVLHAPVQGGLVAKAIGGWPPFALLVCLEMISRIPVRSKFAGILRVGIAIAVSGMAGFISFEHQLAFIRGEGFTGTTGMLIPLTIDGVMMVATICLFEVSTNVRVIRVSIRSLKAEGERVAEAATKPVEGTVSGRPGRKHGPQRNQPGRRAPARSTLKADGASKVPPRQRDEPKPPAAPVVTVVQPEVEAVEIVSA